MKKEKEDEAKDSKETMDSDDDISPEKVNSLIKEAQGKEEAMVKVEEEAAASTSGRRGGKKSKGGAKGKKEVETKEEKKPDIDLEGERWAFAMMHEIFKNDCLTEIYSDNNRYDYDKKLSMHVLYENRIFKH